MTAPVFLIVCLLPLFAFALAAAPLSGWLIDDALISFAYARNFAEGAGLVAQPGKVPVEGFSNPLWTFLFVPEFWVSSAVPLVLAKALGHLLAFATFIFGFHIVRRVSGSALAAVLAMLFLALNPSFVAWSVSGLENVLFGFETMALTYLCLSALDRADRRVAVAAGLVVAAAALTRPDGLAFAVLWPFAVLVRTAAERRLAPGSGREALAYGAAAVLPFAAYKLAALAYFGSLFPNTYFAKGAPSIDRIREILTLDGDLVFKVADILRSPFGFLGLTLGLFAGAGALSLRVGRVRRQIVLLAGATGLAFLHFALMPPDWAPEFRFGTPFIVLFYPTVFSFVWIAVRTLPPSRLYSRQFPALLVFAVLAVCSIFVQQIRFARFYATPPAPYTEISERYGARFAEAARALGVARASFLIQDVGGPLFDNRLDVVDIAGLVDATIARTLWTDKPAMRAYIFEQAKPTFILTYAYSALEADLDSSPRFRADYVPLREAVDAIASERAGRTIYSGDYIRRDLVAGQPGALTLVRKILYGADD